MIDFSTLKLNRNMLEMYDYKQENLKILRMFLGISLKEVSTALEIDPATMSKYEHGKRNMGDKRFISILCYYSKEFDKLDEQELTIERVIKSMNLIRNDGLTEKGKKMLNILKSFE